MEPIKVVWGETELLSIDEQMLTEGIQALADGMKRVISRDDAPDIVSRAINIVRLRMEFIELLRPSTGEADQEQVEPIVCKPTQCPPSFAGGKGNDD